MKDFYIGRQPILNRKNEIVAYEILFRSQNMLTAGVTDNAAATARVLINALQNLGLPELIGDKKAFINADENILMEGALDILPKENFVIEILESVKLTEPIRKKIKEYKEKGYSFALDDVEFTAEYLNEFSDMFGEVDYIKLDYMLADKKNLHKNMDIIKKTGVQLLAEKVETREEYEHCMSLGFDLFQGYYFAKPVILTGTSVDSSKTATVQLINLLRQDADIEELEKVMKNYPDLNINLLKFMNSAAFFTKGSITSIRHAMTMLGRQNLSKWLYLVLYAGTNNDNYSNSLLMVAQLRAKTMEKLCEKSIIGKKKADSAYLVGLMSLLDTVFNKDIRDVVKDFNLDDELKVAVTDMRGDLGMLLKTVKCYESDSIEELVSCFKKLKISFDDFNKIMLESYSWTNKLVCEYKR